MEACSDVMSVHIRSTSLKEQTFPSMKVIVAFGLSCCSLERVCENLERERPMMVTFEAAVCWRSASIVPRPMPDVEPAKTAVGDVGLVERLASRTAFKDTILKVLLLLTKSAQFLWELQYRAIFRSP